MKRLKAFGCFWYDFVVGDDWRIAAAVVAGLGLTGLLVHVLHIPAWWVLPTGVVVGLSGSLWLATRGANPPKP